MKILSRAPAACLLTFLLFVFFSVGVSAAAPEPPAGAETLEATLADWVSGLLARERYDLALDVMRLGTALYPDDPNSYALRAQIHTRMGRIRDALNDWDRAVTMAPDDALFLAGRGTLYAMSGEIGTARDDLDRAAELGANDPRVYFFRGLYYLSQMRHETALADFDEALALDAGFADARVRRAFARYMLGRVGGARADLEEALKTAPDDPDALNLYGIVLATLGDVEQGLAVFQRAETADPKFSGVYINKGYLEFQKGNVESARENFRKSLAVEPENPYALCNMAELNIHENAIDAARPFVERCIKTGRENMGFWKDLRRYLRGMRRAKKALDAGGGAAIRFDALVREGDAAFEAGDHERAYAPYALALMLNFKDPHLLYQMGLVCLSLEEFNHAATFFHQLIHYAPDDPLAAKARVRLQNLEEKK